MIFNADRRTQGRRQIGRTRPVTFQNSHKDRVKLRPISGGGYGEVGDETPRKPGGRRGVKQRHTIAMSSQRFVIVYDRRQTKWNELSRVYTTDVTAVRLGTLRSLRC